MAARILMQGPVSHKKYARFSAKVLWEDDGLKAHSKSAKLRTRIMNT